MGDPILVNKMLKALLLLSLVYCASSERVREVSTHTSSCFTCGMIEGTSYLTVKICGSTDCCLSRSLDSDSIDWLPGNTNHFIGESNLLECADYEIGSKPFSVTAFHDGSDGLTLDWIQILTESSNVM